MKVDHQIINSNVWQSTRTGLYFASSFRSSHVGIQEIITWQKELRDAYTGQCLPHFCRNDPEVMGSKRISVTVEKTIRIIDN